MGEKTFRVQDISTQYHRFFLDRSLVTVYVTVTPLLALDTVPGVSFVGLGPWSWNPAVASIGTLSWSWTSKVPLNAVER